MIRVQVWAKSSITRAGLEAIVRSDPRFEIAGLGTRSPDLLSVAGESAPDVLLLDLADTSITQLRPKLSDQPSSPSVVVLLDTLTRAEILRTLQSGVRAIVAPESDPREITAALEAAHDGLAVFSPEILDVLLPTTAEASGDAGLPPAEPLTERESRVLELMAEGAGNKEIAARLQISEHTVKFHVSSILSKLSASSRTEAVSRGYRDGLILI